MIKKNYQQTVIATLCFTLASMTLLATSVKHRTNSTSTTTNERPALEPPEFFGYGYTGEEDFIALDFENGNEGASTEIWHSLNETSGYTLVATVGPGVTDYYHYNLKPRTMHYYKARAILGSEMSPFSEVYSQMTYSKNYPPDFTARAINETTVELTLTDRSYNSDYYEVQTDYWGNFFNFSTDSGETKVIYHHPVVPGTTYNYSVTLIPHHDQPDVTGIATASVTTPLPSCTSVGSVEREVWTDITGGKVSTIPRYQTPNSISTITSLQAPTNAGNNYGARIRGYLCPPQTGNYIFYMSSDDQSELWVSTDANPETAKLVASVTGYTNVGQWDKYPTQKSAAIALTSGKTYYFEVLHKEAGSGDHLSVGWQLPNGALERPIGGNRLIKFSHPNYDPFIEITSPAEQVTFQGPASFTVTTKVYDPDSEISRVEFRMNNQLIGTDNTAPYTVNVTNLGSGQHSIWATVYTTDGQTETYGRTVFVTMPSCAGTGYIQREIWRNIPGTSISSVDFNSPPGGYQQLTSFETGQYMYDNYGSRIRGYVCVPQSGAYTFWISSDDNSELWLSTDEIPSNKRKIASVTGVTKFRDYTKYPSQQSVLINLVAGRKYYIEALHKEGTGNDFVSVGWQLPNGTLERPIAGNHLIPIAPISENQPPTIAITSPANNSTFTAGSNISFRANASDTDGSVYKVTFEANSVVFGEDSSAPYEITWTNVQAGSYHIIARVEDDRGARGFDDIYITVGPSTACSGTGTIYWEKWTGIAGTSLSSVPFDTEPDIVTPLSQFSTPNYTGNEYGSRIRAYLCVPVSGAYAFLIASDDNSELWLSTDENPVNKTRIAYVAGAIKGWSHASPHRSAPVNLVGGRRYYIEARHKEGNGADFVQVAWLFPDGTFEGPIPGSRLSPYEDLSTAANAFAVEEIRFGTADEGGVSIYPNPATKGGELKIVLSDMDETMPVVEIMSATGQLMQSKQAVASHNELTVQLDKPYTQGIYLVKIIGSKRQWIRKLEIR